MITPSYEYLSAPTLVAGKSALPYQLPESTDESYRSRVPLLHSGVVQADASHHPLAHSIYRHRRFTPDPAVSLPQTENRLEGPSIFGGIVSMHFGHVLTQSLGRLWAHELSPTAPIVFLPETLRVTELPGFLTALIRSFGIQNPLMLMPHSVICEHLLIPQDICNLSHRPAAQPFFRDWLKRHRPAVLGEQAGRLYVSRSRLGLQQGHYLQERLLEVALIANGYDVFHPQEHSLSEQISAYSKANQLIFADGSAAHLWSLAAPGGQDVAVVLRRPRDRAFVNWFRSLDCGRIHYIDCVIADFGKRGDGPGRSVALLDMAAVWSQLRTLGFHQDSRQIGIERARLDAWVAALPRRFRWPLGVPFDLDQLSLQILSLRRHVNLRRCG